MERDRVDHPQELRLASFATGYGGLDLAISLALAPVRTVVAVEIEAFAAANLVQKMEAGRLDPAPLWTDLRTFPGREFHGLVDIVAAGYPCQPFSLAGRRRGTADPRHLWPVILGHIRSIVPGLCICENVLGHVSLGLREVRAAMVGLGYRFDAEVVAAVEVGARHLRRRVFWIAARPDTIDLLRSRRRPSDGPAPIGREGLQAAAGRGGDPPHAERDELWLEPGGGSGAGRSGARFAGDHGEEGTPADADDRRQQEQQEQHSKSEPGAQPPCGDDAERLGASGWDAADSNRGGCEVSALLCERESLTGGDSERPPQPVLGGRPHALAHRVDRLRLAGNGVVPAQAEFAIRTILGRMLGDLT